MIFGIDVDGVFRDFTNSLKNVFKRDFPGENYDIEANCWDWFNNYPWYRLGISSDDWIKSRFPSIILESDFIEGCTKEDVINLIDLVNSYSEKFNKSTTIKFITQQPLSMRIHTSEWMKDKFKGTIALDVPIVFVEKGHHKWIHSDIMIDDSPHVIMSKPEHKAIIKVETSWNTLVNSEISVTKIQDVDYDILRRIYDAMC
jgi:hypothetical protein